MMWSDHSRRGIAIAVLHGLAVRLAPPPGIRPASAPKPWGHHRLVGGFFPPAPLEGRHGVSPAMVGKYRG